ncbi:MAG: DUF4118 domain-containing protein [Alphaproteobacteria bacterium]|nr:DUF4118 domain-containing protein [Alphaproteobacteria bacterium]MCB9696348.1 DUF4118 domain-containing protein [Alphaproteobacteria bacterium]
MTSWRDATVCVVLVGAATLASASAGALFAPEDIVMAYVVAVLAAAFAIGRRTALLAPALSVAAYNFFFVPPFYTFEVSDTRHLLTFGVLFGAGVLVTTLVQRLRAQQDQTRARAERLQALCNLSGELVGTRDEEGVAGVARSAGARLLGVPVDVALDEALPSPDLLVFGAPLPKDREEAALAVTHQVSLALERVRNDRRAAAADRRARAEEVRAALLSTVSHDLRTPLAAIVGAAAAVQENRDLDEVERDELLGLVRSEGQRMEQLVTNLLDMTRLAASDPGLRREWIPVDELVGSALRRTRDDRGGRRVDVELDPHLPLAHVDPLLFEQLLVNLLQNAFRHTPPSSTVWITVQGRDDLRWTVHDDGPGLPADPEALLEPFVRGDTAARGSGLGLAICRAVARAHGGELDVGSGPNGGAAFHVLMPPRDEPEPEVPLEEVQ